MQALPLHTVIHVWGCQHIFKDCDSGAESLALTMLGLVICTYSLTYSPRWLIGSVRMLASDKTTFLLSIWLIEQALFQRDVVLVPPHAMFSSHLHVPNYAMNEQSELLAFAKSITLCQQPATRLSLCVVRPYTQVPVFQSYAVLTIGCPECATKLL